MPDYIYLLENRLSADQRHALEQLREAARDAGTILFLTGDAVRDLTSGHAVRELEVAVQINALKLKKSLEKRGAKIWGEDETSRSLYLCFPGTVRVDLISTHRVEYPKPGRRDFTVNSMAISLNEGSFGLLMDPLNGAADIEFRTLRLVSNYGFLEEPSLLIRATRYMARLGWEMDPRTQTRYANAKDEGVIESVSAHARSRELEQIGHEEDGLKVLRALDAEGWMKILFAAWTPAKADEEKLKALHDLAVELLLQGVHADMSAAQMQLLTAKLPPRDLTALKKHLLRPGFVEEWNSLDALAAGFAKALQAKQNAAPSASYKLFTSYDPEAVLWLGFTSKVAAIQERYNLFLKVWPEARQRIPLALMQEMRITPELPGYTDLVQAVFLELIDGRLTTPEEMRAYLEPHSPPAPPPQVSVKRSRAKRSTESKLKERAFDEGGEGEDELGGDEDLDDLGADDEDELDLGLPLATVGLELKDQVETEEEAEEEEELAVVTPPFAVKTETQAAGKKAPKPERPAARPGAGKVQPVAAETPVPRAQPEATSKPAPTAKAAAAPAKPAPTEAKTKQAPAAAVPPAKKLPVKPVAAKAAKPAVKPAPPAKAQGKAAVKTPAKSAANAASRPASKAPAKAHPKSVPVKPKPAKANAAHGATAKAGKSAAKNSKPAVKKPAPKKAKKR